MSVVYEPPKLSFLPFPPAPTLDFPFWPVVATHSIFFVDPPLSPYLDDGHLTA